MANGIVKAQDLAVAKDDIEKRCELKLHAGLSYKCISRDLGLSNNQIARIRKECGVSARTYRDGYGALGVQVSKFTTDAPAHKVQDMVKLFSAKNIKAIT
jgi:DNA-binding transcriptional regulator YiaG